MTPFRLMYDREVTTTLDAVLSHECDNGETDGEYITELAEVVREIASISIRQQQEYNSRRSNLRHRRDVCEPGQRVSVWTPIRRRRLSENLLKW